VSHSNPRPRPTLHKHVHASSPHARSHHGHAPHNLPMPKPALPPSNRAASSPCTNPKHVPNDQNPNALHPTRAPEKRRSSPHNSVQRRKRTHPPPPHPDPASPETLPPPQEPPTPNSLPAFPNPARRPLQAPSASGSPTTTAQPLRNPPPTPHRSVLSKKILHPARSLLTAARTCFADAVQLSAARAKLSIRARRKSPSNEPVRHPRTRPAFQPEDIYYPCI
jgi:hypothetical protein